MSPELAIETLTKIQDYLENKYRSELNDVINWIKSEYGE